MTKLNATGNGLEFSTYIGGIAEDTGESIAVDINNNTYVTGSTNSPGFPTTQGAYDTDVNSTEAFKLYAAAIGKGSKELTAAEKQIALLNFVLDSNLDRFKVLINELA